MSIQLVSTDSTATDIVSLSDMKLHLRIDGTSDDTYVTSLINSAATSIEEESGRDFLDKTWDEVLPKFSDKMELLRPPLKTVSSVKYYDTDGTQQTLSSATYIVVTPSRMPGFIGLGPSQTWPAIQTRPDSVVIRYTTGYTTPPENLKHCVKLLCGLWYESRENLEMGKQMSSAGIERLVNQLSHGGYY